MAHIIVDAYNVIRRISRFIEAERRGLESGRDALLFALEEFGATSGHRITAVFDGGGAPFDVGEFSSVEKFAGIDVIFSRRGSNADDVIVSMVKEERSEKIPTDVIVVSDDIVLRSEVAEAGGYIMSSELFYEMMRGNRPVTY